MIGIQTTRATRRLASACMVVALMSGCVAPKAVLPDGTAKVPVNKTVPAAEVIAQQDAATEVAPVAPATSK